MIIPRVGKADAPDARAEPVARLRGIAGAPRHPAVRPHRHVRRLDPAELEIAAWDDHPNALGHRRLFLALARALVEDATLYATAVPGRGSPDRTTADPTPRSE